MDLITFSLWGISVPLMVFTALKKKTSIKSALQKAKGMMSSMLLDIVAIIFLIGLGLTLITPDQIARALRDSGLIGGTLIAALAGTITLIPAFVAFPLVGTLIDGGTHIVPAVAFLTTLTMVGIKTIPLEAKEFGLKFSLYRSLFSFIAALVIALFMGMFL
jgi:uncharacterized membrane protein YraQ (UPF0718 family)